jgi:SAM-dependent methyltransferase
MMTSPRDDDATLGRIYADLADRHGDREDAAQSRSAADRLALMRRYRESPGSLLDVGCGTGLFVCAARRVGWRATGLDASEQAVAGAGQRCPRARFRTGPVAEIDFPAGSFDVVTLARSGFALADVRPRRVPLTLAAVMDRLAQSPGGSGALAGRLSEVTALRRLTIRFPIGEMYVVARRADGTRDTDARA